MVARKFLQSHALFGGVGDADMEAITPMLKEQEYEAGEFIIKEGERGDRLYFLCEGSVEILKDHPSSCGVATKRLAVLCAGDSFGEMEFIDVQCRSASVRALEKASVLTLSNQDLYKIYESNVETFVIIIMNMAREISRRLRKMDALVASCLYWDYSGQGRPSGQTKAGDQHESQ